MTTTFAIITIGCSVASALVAVAAAYTHGKIAGLREERAFYETVNHAIEVVFRTCPRCGLELEKTHFSHKGRKAGN